jgi:hypothetical protein
VKSRATNHGAALYHQLGRIAQAQRDFKAAEEGIANRWDFEKQGNDTAPPAPITTFSRIAQEQRL